MGFMSGFFGSAATTFADEQARQRELALRKLQTDISQQTADANSFQNLYNSFMASWPNLDTNERLNAYATFANVADESGLFTAVGFRDLMANQLRTGMSVNDARDYLAELASTPFDPSKPYARVPQFLVQQALESVKNEADYDLIKSDVESYLKFTEENADEIIDISWRLARAQPALAEAQVNNLDASTNLAVQELGFNEEEQGFVLERLSLGNQLLSVELAGEAIRLGYLDERLQAELQSILLGNERVANDNRLFGATFDLLVREMTAKVGIAESQARVLLATEALDIAIKQGQVDQIPLLLENLRLGNDNLTETTRGILLNNDITEASQAALISLNHSQARLASSEANMAAVREGQYSQELAANLARNIASVRLTESQTVGQNEANRLAQAVFDDEVARVAAESGISQSAARVAVATEVSRVQAADLANILTRGNINAQDLANAFADRTLDDRVRGIAASREISESEARVAIATEDDTIEAAGLALESTRAQIALTNASTELTNEQKSNIGRAFLSSLITSGQPALVDLFGKDVLEPAFGEAWESALESVKEAAGITADRTEQAFVVDVALRTEQTRLAASSADLNEFEFAARNSNPLMSEAEVIEFVTKTLGQPPLRDIVSNIDDLTSLQFSTVNAETLRSQLLSGDIDPSSLESLAPILKGFGIEIDMIGEVPTEALEFAIATMELEQLAQEDAISRRLGIYATNLYKNGHRVTMDIMGLDPTNPRHVELWDRASSTFPANYLPVLQFSEALEDLSAEDSLKVLEAAALLGTRFAEPYGVYAESTAEAISSPEVMRYVVDALKEDYDRINGEGAWERLNIPDDPGFIFGTLIEPEFDAYFNLKRSINGDLIRSIGIEYDPTDPSSWENTISKMDSVVSYLSATPEGGQSFLGRVREAGVGRFSLLGWGGPAVAEAKAFLVEDFIRNVLSGNEDLVEQLGIAERSGATAFNWSGQPKWVNVDTDALESLASDILKEFGETSNSIYTLKTRYH
jgi:hypothetical protein